ncbi:MAG: S9 family peptidase [Candidatus Aminicenantales bacterium]
MNKRKRLIFLIFFISLAFADSRLSLAGQVQEPAARKVTMDDFYALKEIRQPAFSPDGRWVAYVLTVKDKEKNSRNADLWMVPTEGGTPIRLTYHEKNDTRPRWSPDGRSLAFLSNRDGKNQIWLFNSLGGEPYRLTSVETGVEDFIWAPDSSHLAFIAQDPKEKAADKEKEPEAIVINRLQHKRDGEGYLDERRRHIYLISAEGGQPRKLTDGPYDEEDLCFSPDGKEIFFTSNRTANPDSNRNTDIWAIEISTGKIRQVTTSPKPESNPAVSPRGEFVAYLQTNSPVYGTNFLFHSPVQAGSAFKLTEALDRNILPGFVYSPDNAFIYFIVEDSGNQHLARLAPGSRKIERLVAGEIVVTDLACSNDGKFLAFISGDSLNPAELYVCSQDGRDVKKITRHNEGLLRRLRLSSPENIHYRSFDGQEIEGWVIKPVDFMPGQKYPMIVRVHGGPNAQFSTSFSHEFQLLAAEGYVVLYVNPRGSSGYGEPFGRAIWADWGNKDLKDILAGVDYVLKQGYVDPQKIGIYGWSYGGILTNYAITRTNRFQAAVSGASDSDYFSCYGYDDLQLWWEEELGLPWQNFDLYRKLSPIKDVAKVKTPTLFLCGQFDYRCPLPQSEQMYLSLKRLGVKTELVIYPGESHSLSRLDFQIDRLRRVLDWFNQFLK